MNVFAGLDLGFLAGAALGWWLERRWLGRKVNEAWNRGYSSKYSPLCATGHHQMESLGRGTMFACRLCPYTESPAEALRRRSQGFTVHPATTLAEAAEKLSREAPVGSERYPGIAGSVWSRRPARNGPGPHGAD